jgi:hypothetical protein
MSNYKGGSETEVFVTEITPIIVAEHPQNEAGSWKSGLFACCKYGCFHPALLCGWCFPTILMGQVSYVFLSFHIKKTARQITIIDCFINNNHTRRTKKKSH